MFTIRRLVKVEDKPIPYYTHIMESNATKFNSSSQRLIVVEEPITVDDGHKGVML